MLHWYTSGPLPVLCTHHYKCWDHPKKTVNYTVGFVVCTIYQFGIPPFENLFAATTCIMAVHTFLISRTANYQNNIIGSVLGWVVVLMLTMLWCQPKAHPDPSPPSIHDSSRISSLSINTLTCQYVLCPCNTWTDNIHAKHSVNYSLHVSAICDFCNNAPCSN